METTAFSHTGNIGDCIAAIPAMNEYFKKTGKQIDLYLKTNVPATYYEGATHPTRDATGGQVMLNSKMVEMMVPLFLAQPCIASVKEWEEEEIAVRLEAIRESYVGMPNLCLSRWYFYVYPDLAADLTKTWLTIPETDKDIAKGKIMITRSERYLNDRVDYSFLKPYEDELLFSGTMREYNNFCMAFDLNVKKLTVNTFLDVGQAIQQSRFHISNQTMAFQISQGLKKPRIVELCGFAPNVMVQGEGAYDFFAQPALEYYFAELYKKTA